MSNSYSSITVPGYTVGKPVWEQYQKLALGGNAIINELEALPGENAAALKNRKAMAFDIAALKNEIQRQISILSLSGVEITVEGNAALEALAIADQGIGVDGAGKTLTQFLLTKVLEMALTYGLAYVVVDRTVISQTQTEAEIEKLPSPYAYVISPLDVPAYEYKTTLKSDLHQAIIKRNIFSNPELNNLGFPSDTETVHTLWTGDAISTQDSKGDLMGKDRVNPLGFVPILAFDLRSSFLFNVWRPAIAAAHHISLSSAAGSSQVYGTIFISSDQDIKSINTGFNKAVKLPADSRVEIHNSPVSGMTWNKEFAEKTIMSLIMRQLKQNMTSMSQGALQQSGISKKMDSISQEQFSSYLVDELAVFAPRLVNLLGAYLAPDQEMITNTKKPDEFITNDRDADRADASYLSLNYTPKTETSFIAAEKEIRRLSGLENSMSSAEIKTDNEQIEEAAKRRFASLDFEDEGGSDEI